MSIVHTTISVSFVRILTDICSVLDTEAPEYKVGGPRGDCMSVSVKVPGSRIEHIFYGTPEETPDACAEAAARRMAVFLVQRYNILVVDLNLEQRVRNEQCAQLYGCKYDSLHRIHNELPAASRYEIVPVEGLDYGITRVELDFMALMKEVVDLFRIAVTPITVLRTMTGCFIAWFSISVPGSVSPSHGIAGFKASSIGVAKQILAKEALMLMSMWYRFEVEDVSYFLLANSSHVMDAKRGVYERLRERVYGLRAVHVPMPAVVEDDCSTPRGKRNAIPDMHQPPPPPKRPRMLNLLPARATSDALSDSASTDAFSL